MSNYLTYRGKCKELVDAAIISDPSLKAVRGYYYCPIWGKQAHWWCIRANGTIYDPSVRQFPTAGFGADYVEFDGYIQCEFCHESVAESDAYFYGHHGYCSYECYGHDVGF